MSLSEEVFVVTMPTEEKADVEGTPEDGEVVSVDCIPDACIEELKTRTSEGPAPGDLCLLLLQI